LDDSSNSSNLTLTTEIVANYIGNHKLSSKDLETVIKTVYETLLNLDAPAQSDEPVVEKRTPSQVRKSITDQGLVSFEDGKTYQTLKRHLARRGLTLAEYKAKWGLPNDYPATSPAYSAKRSELAKAIGLGRDNMQDSRSKPSKPGRAPKAKP
jgi:predicted transcriptional regulator